MPNIALPEAKFELPTFGGRVMSTEFNLPRVKSITDTRRVGLLQLTKRAHAWIKTFDAFRPPLRMQVLRLTLKSLISSDRGAGRGIRGFVRSEDSLG